MTPACMPMPIPLVIEHVHGNPCPPTRDGSHVDSSTLGHAGAKAWRRDGPGLPAPVRPRSGERRSPPGSCAPAGVTRSTGREARAGGRRCLGDGGRSRVRRPVEPALRAAYGRLAVVALVTDSAGKALVGGRDAATGADGTPARVRRPAPVRERPARLGAGPGHPRSGLPHRRTASPGAALRGARGGGEPERERLTTAARPTVAHHPEPPVRAGVPTTGARPVHRLSAACPAVLDEGTRSARGSGPAARHPRRHKPLRVNTPKASVRS